MPWLPAVKEIGPGKTTFGSLGALSWTVPVYPVATLPYLSYTVTVTIGSPVTGTGSVVTRSDDALAGPTVTGSTASGIPGAEILKLWLPAAKKVRLNVCEPLSPGVKV